MAATADMPLMVDAAMDVDLSVTVDNALSVMDHPMPLNVDLFGDPLELRPTIASKQLQQRVDELRARGACQGIAWSRQGTVASISKDGRSIDLRFLRCHPENGTWGLSEPSTHSVFSNTLPGCPITHLAWAATSSTELAVIDSVGRVSILTFSITVNRPYLSRRWDADVADDLHAVVGCYWLPVIPQSRQFYIIYGPASRDGSSYKYETSVGPAFGPWHPNTSKSALVCVTTNGLLKLFYPQNNNKIEETTLELESVTSSDDLITHASICSDRNGLLITLATASKQLKVIRATIHWGLPPTDKHAPPGSISLTPAIKEKHVAVTSWLQQSPHEMHLDTSMALLSHTEVLPSTLEGPPGPSPIWTPALIITVRSHLVTESSSYSQDQQSVIDRWELSEHPQTLHSAFEQLGIKAEAGSSPPLITRLRKLEPIVIPKIIISVHPMQLGKVLCFAFSDGTIQYRDRSSFAEIYNEQDINRVMVFSQVGFQFTEETPCLQVAFSPTNCSFAQICEDSKIKWSSMKYISEDLASIQDDPYSAVIAALTVAMATAAIQAASYDDILAVARPFAQRERFSYDWMMEIVRLLKVAVDYSEEAPHDSLVRNNNLQLCLSILNHLGFHGEFRPRSFGGKFATLALNVRNIIILISIASNTPTNLKEKLSPLDEPEVVDALAGCAKWTLDLLSWLVDCLLNLLDDEKFTAILTNQTRFSEIAAYLQSKNDVSLHLMLCSSTRGFLMAACRRLMHLDTLSNKAIVYYEERAAKLLQQSSANSGSAASRTPLSLYHAYQKMHSFTSSSMIKIADFDKLLAVLGQDIRAAYQSSLKGLATQQQGAQAGGGANDPAKRAQTHCELNMLLAGAPPAAFQVVLAKFFGTHLRAFRAGTDSAKLFFYDYTLLEVDDDRRGLQDRRARGRYIDTFRRCELIAPAATRTGGAGAGGGGSAVGEASRSEDPAETTAANGTSEPPRWRRCARCAAVMEDVYAHRTGFTFVLAQQRKCMCGGSWGMLPKDSLVA